MQPSPQIVQSAPSSSSFVPSPSHAHDHIIFLLLHEKMAAQEILWKCEPTVIEAYRACMYTRRTCHWVQSTQASSLANADVWRLVVFSCKWLVIQYIIRCYFCLSTSANNCRFPNKKWNLQLIRYWMKWILQESLVRTKKPQPHWKKKKIVYEVASFHVLIVSGSRLGRLGNIQKKVWINTKEQWRDTMYRMR